MTQTASTTTVNPAEAWSCPEWCTRSAEHAEQHAARPIHPVDGPFHEHVTWPFETSEGSEVVKLVQSGDRRPELFIGDLLVTLPQARTLAHLILAATEAAR